MVNHWKQVTDLMATAHEYIDITGNSNRQVGKEEEVQFVLLNDEDTPAIFDSTEAKWASGDQHWVTISSRMLVDKVLVHMRKCKEKTLRRKYIDAVRYMQNKLPILHQTLTQDHLAIPFHSQFVTSCLIAHILFDRPLPIQRTGFKKVATISSTGRNTTP